MSDIRLAVTDEDILDCHPVLAQLRPHLPRDRLVARVRLQMEQGYRLVCLATADGPVAVAGYRLLETLAWARILYVDDLVTLANARSQGHGRALFAWLVRAARCEGCASLQLDSGVQRFDAHRFYLRERMVISSHHFSLPLAD
jgi:GNAT superfamily N-acetyltransferase